MSPEVPKPAAEVTLGDFASFDEEGDSVQDLLEESKAAAQLDEVVRTANEGPVTAESLFGVGVQLTSAHPHGSNILKKARDIQRDEDQTLAPLIRGIAERYKTWRSQSESLACDDVDDPAEYVEEQASLYQAYRDTLDHESVDAFDSRGALQPSALEEFCYFLLRPVFAPFEQDLALGHREVFQGLYFTAPTFASFAEMPTPHYPTGNLDFVIGKKIDSNLSTERTSKTKSIYVPAVALECKTYLDRPRWIESDILASNIKRGFPGCLYIVVSEFLKLDLAKVNVLGSQIDKVYVLRRAKNVDRKIRRADGSGLKPIHAPALLDLFERVRDHLREDWVSPESWEDSGVLK
ncbi:Bpu10I family restriction endonuclease [Knoellia sp. p5-6-4]|uniref:Bpu10I family restriction endonuclease n=1 Tax=unclassified Knoellia TaxID=2618719 RepID=UPI0023DC2072|nr:Bpu10I family restriction endonuclease [Knoellia sp. p5-6-4]MDF2144639.1 Bpu10I family restriction endonuclease [Knoellia sp. p5-6-4]